MANKPKVKNLTDARPIRLDDVIVDDAYLDNKELAYLEQFKKGVHSTEIIKNIWGITDPNEISRQWIKLLAKPQIKRAKEIWGQQVRELVTKEHLVRELIVVLNTTEEESMKVKCVESLAKLLNYYEPEKHQIDMNISFGLNI